MKHKQMLLGFDIREMWLRYSDNWSQERRQTFLLRTDIDKPLSTDSLVWPSAVRSEDKSQMLAYQDLVSLIIDLAQIYDYVESGGKESLQPSWIIGITVMLSGLTKEEKELREHYSIATMPSTPDSQWKSLGYDVSDLSFLSGLSNCGYTDQDERNRLSQRFGQHLNEYHLFDDIHSADEFRAVSNSLVSEHAPFFVYGLYLIKAT